MRLLQAQIEPHFLFNTLSNILSLIETDLEKAKSMLVDLIHYLRTSLSKTRYETTTVAQEMELIRAYLNIFKVRMGDRLRYEIDIPDMMKDLPFPPPVLSQTLMALPISAAQSPPPRKKYPPDLPEWFRNMISCLPAKARGNCSHHLALP